MDPFLPSSLIGAGIGAGTAGFDIASRRKQEKQAQEASRPKRRRLFALQQSMNEQEERKLAGMGMLSQAAFDWASAIR